MSREKKKNETHLNTAIKTIDFFHILHRTHRMYSVIENEIWMKEWNEKNIYENKWFPENCIFISCEHVREKIHTLFYWKQSEWKENLKKEKENERKQP